MVEINGLKFSTSIAVLFALREAEGHTTLQETYASLTHSDIDRMIEVMRICYEKGENKKLTAEEFLNELGNYGIGYVKMSKIYAQIIEKIMCDGLSQEEIDAAKKLAKEKMPKA